MQTFYRICNPQSQQGLWYTPSGEHVGLIHSTYNFCKAATLQMPFDQELVGWLSATPDLEQFWQWFSKEEVLKLQEHGFYIHVYEATETKFYKPYAHTVIKQNTSRIVGKFTLFPHGGFHFETL